MNDHLILALETSSTICSVAVIRGQECLALREEIMPRQHAEILPSFLESVIYESGQEMNAIDAVAVSIGPGSFTGLRIGLGFAKGFAFAHGLPILPIPTLEAMAFGLQRCTPTLGLVLSHGTRIFFQHYSWQDKLPVSVGKPAVNDLEQLLDYFDGNAKIFQWQCQELIPKNLDFITAIPSARWVGLLGNEKYDQLINYEPFELEPDYIVPFKVGARK